MFELSPTAITANQPVREDTHIMAATATRGRRAASAKPAEPETVEVDEEFEDMEDDEDTTAEVEETDEDDDLEELEEDEEPEPAPKPKARKAAKATGTKTAPPKQEKVAFGSAELAAHVTEVTGETYDARAIRMLLRKLAKDEQYQRAVGEDRSRYSFTGPEDEAVKLVVQMVKSGAAKELKQAGLQAVKDKAAAKKAAAKLAKEAQAEVDEDEEMEDVEEEAPKPRRRTATKAAAPAKAQPSTRRRTAAKS